MNRPMEPGSGGWGAFGGMGGGLIRIEAEQAVVLNGALMANGGNSQYGGDHQGAGGAGGGIFVNCSVFTGDTNGLLLANGGNGSGTTGGGGGGRIAVWRRVPGDLRDQLASGSVPGDMEATAGWESFLGTVSVVGGKGFSNPPDTNAAGAGSVIFLDGPLCGPVFYFK
jgi:hypothetical protein